MNKTALMIKNRLSLRLPQEEGLCILEDIANRLTLKKNSNITSEFEKIKNYYPTFQEFERTFPSICFSLATGVGKTRLMGAFIAYLYLEKGIKNFFVLAPNLTIYNKLIDDFKNINSPKYVFKGISDFVHNPPEIITGDNYNDHVHGQINALSDICINIFNISKINAEARGGKQPQIKRLWEYIGQSYFDYLSKLDDLVLLMDESHHYRAERGMDVINELNPILGLEVTATPQVEKQGKSLKFKNVVYEYSLAKAIKDGFVKDPAVATRKDFNPDNKSQEDIDRIKLEDGIRINEDTKVAIDIYARDNKLKPIKPFVLVVAKDTTHSKQLMELIKSDEFFDGYYMDKVMEINSNQKGEEKDENIKQLISLENADNKIEIVIHVNMLKEGWDVTNLYTIIPLRTAASATLREQTIGRGLRLPYGKKTGNDKVDRLTIVSHDKFQEIIDLANKPDSLIRLENVIDLGSQDIDEKKEVVTSHSKIDVKLIEEQKNIDKIEIPEAKHKAEVKLDVRRNLLDIILNLNNNITSITELKKIEVKKLVLEKIEQSMNVNPQQTFSKVEIIKEATRAYESIVEEFIKDFIEIPKIIIQQGSNVKSGFKEFVLDTKNLNYQPNSEEIIIQRLRDNKSFEILTKAGKIKYGSLENMIINELVKYPEIEYDKYTELLFNLVSQSINKFRSYLEESQIINVIQFNKKEISKFIYMQMREHFYCEAIEYVKPLVYPFTKLEDHNYSKYTKDDIYHYTQTITPTADIPKKLFSGFKKACHVYYKFDSKTEKDFSIILEDEHNEVIKWLRPALNQFRIYWDNNSKQYHPDFVAETKNAIYIIETKKAKEIDSTEVQDKAKAALEYCKYASEYTAQNGGKPWKYILIPHSVVKINMTFGTIVNSYEM